MWGKRSIVMPALALVLAVAAPASADEQLDTSNTFAWVSAGGDYGLAGVAPFLLEAGLFVNFGSRVGYLFPRGFELDYTGILGKGRSPMGSESGTDAAARARDMSVHEIRLYPLLGIGWADTQVPTAENGSQYRNSTYELRLAGIARFAGSDIAAGGDIHFYAGRATNTGASNWGVDVQAMFGTDSSTYFELTIDAGSFDLAATPGRFWIAPKVSLMTYDGSYAARVQAGAFMKFCDGACTGLAIGVIGAYGYRFSGDTAPDGVASLEELAPEGWSVTGVLTFRLQIK